jgi:hypothetical protein
MAITVKHSKVSTIPDDADTSLVRPSDWNADHTLTGTVPVANGGTGAATLTGYVIGNGTSAMTASTTIPSGDVSGLGTMATQNANAVAITGGTVNGTTIGATTPSTGAFSYASTNSTTSTTPALGYNASNASFVNGATIAGSYLQNVMQNKSGTAGASTNFAVSNDLGTDSTYYGEFGMNSSVYSSGTPADFFSINNGVYFSGHDGDMTLGSGNGYKTYLAWGTTGQSAHVINATGAIGLNTNITGTTNFGTSGQVLTSAGSGATPTWTTPTTGSVTSVSATVPSFLSVTGSPITSSGTLALSYSGTALPVLNGGTGVTTSTGTGAVVLGTRPTLSVTGAGLTLQDATDTTKTANFVLSGLTTGTNYTYALPVVSGSTLAVLGLSQTFTGTQTFGTLTSTGSTTLASTAGSSVFIATSQTSGTFSIGGTAGVATMNIGRSLVTQTLNLHTGVTASGSTKTLNLGTNGDVGSTTNITIGSTTGTSTTTFNGITKNQTYLVANLPSASTSGVGASAFVTDALAPAFGATVVTGGAIAVPVYSDGTNWKVG